MAQPQLYKFLRLLHSLTIPPRRMLALLATFFTFRNIFILYCLLNLKNFPLVWEIRLIYRSWQQWLDKRGVARKLERAASSSTSSKSTDNAGNNTTSLPISTHPLFAPLTITTTTPLLEIDHNLHKSNSTYFTDLDESRTALMVHLLSSTRFSPKELDGEGIKGSFAVVLGSVHATFLKEIKPYELYSVRSRILGWDRKWILIGSEFIRPKNAKDKRREKKEAERRAKASVGTGKDQVSLAETADEILLATCLSKYVVKKGRFTVPPERCWRSAGWLPEKPEGENTPAIVESSAAATPDPELVLGEVKITEDDLRRRAQETAAKAVEKLEQSKNKDIKFDFGRDHDACLKAASRWSWADVEAQRVKGMKIAENWLNLDGQLKALWEERQKGDKAH